VKTRALLAALLVAIALPLAAQDTATLDGEPAIRFMAGHGHLRTYCDGQLWITATRVRFDGVTLPPHSFDLKRSEITSFHPGHALGFRYIKIETRERTYRMGVYPDLGREFGDRFALVERAYRDFPGAYAEVERVAAQRKPPAGLIKASVGKDGPVLEFPVIVGAGVLWFAGPNQVTVWSDADAGAEAYAEIRGGALARGKLEVTADRVRFVSAGAAEDVNLQLDSPKSEMRMNAGAGGYPRVVVTFRSAGKTTLLLGEFTGEPRSLKLYDVTPLLRALGPGFSAMAAELLAPASATPKR
jgi:hypothetical protein